MQPDRWAWRVVKDVYLVEVFCATFRGRGIGPAPRRGGQPASGDIREIDRQIDLRNIELTGMIRMRNIALSCDRKR